MKRNVTQKIISIFAVLAAFLAMPVQVLAQTADENCPNPGPYGVCVPDTDIVIGNVVIDEKTLAFFLVLLLAGALLMSLGFGLRTYTSRK